MEKNMNAFLKSISLILAISVSTISGIKYTGYDLTKFNAPSFRIDELSFYPNWNSSMHSNKSKDTLSYKDENLFTYINIPIQYYTLRHESKFEWDLSIFLTPHFYRDFQQDYLSYLSQKRIEEYSVGNSLQLSGNLTKYLFKLIFAGISINPRVSTGIYNSDHIVSECDTIISDIYKINTMNSSSSRTTLNGGLGLTFYSGIGGIKKVSSALTAINMINFLNDNRNSASANSNERIQQLGSLLEKLSNSSYYDFRHKVISDMEEISRFLLANDYVDSLTPNQILNITDHFLYRNKFSRFYGKEFKFGPIIYRSFSSNKTALENTYYDTLETTEKSSDFLNLRDRRKINTIKTNPEASTQFFSYGVMAFGKYSRPIFYSTQFDIESKLEYVLGRENTISEYPISEIEYPSLYWNLHTKIDYDLSLRSELSLDVNSSFRKKYDYTSLKYHPGRAPLIIDKVNNSTDFDMSIYLTGSWYFSPKSSMSVGINWFWWSTQQKENSYSPIKESRHRRSNIYLQYMHGFL